MAALQEEKVQAVQELTEEARVKEVCIINCYIKILPMKAEHSDTHEIIKQSKYFMTMAYSSRSLENSMTALESYQRELCVVFMGLVLGFSKDELLFNWYYSWVVLDHKIIIFHYIFQEIKAKYVAQLEEVTAENEEKIKVLKEEHDIELKNVRDNRSSDTLSEIEKLKMKHSEKLTKLTERHASNTERLSQQVQSLEEQLSQKEALTSDLRATIHNKEIQLTSQFRDRESELKATISELRTQITENEVLRTQCDELTSHKASSQSQVNELEQQNEELQKQIHELCQNLNDKGNSYKEVETKLEETERTCKELQIKCEGSEKLVKELTNRTEGLNEKLEKLTTEHREALKCQAERLESESTVKLQVKYILL